MPSSIDAASVIPGTTVSNGSSVVQVNGHIDKPSSQPGPVINGKQTTITLFTPAQIAESKFLPSFKSVANEAFRQGHASHGVLPSHIDRITSEQYLLDELGNASGTFTYIIHYHDNDVDVVGTATMWRFTNEKVLEAVGSTADQLEKERRQAIFKRNDPLPPGVEGWELKLMFVNPNAQKQGLAMTLIDLCEAEAKRRVALSKDESIREVRFVLTSIEEINGKFYRKRGFTLDAQASYPPGTMGSLNGFSISHMSKVISTDTL